MDNSNYIKEILAGREGRTEVLTDAVSGATTVYSGIPDMKDPASADQSDWTISRSVITYDTETGGTLVETTWARGLWSNRATLTFNYL